MRPLDAHSQALADALNGGDADADAAETLYLVGAEYMHALGRDLDDLAGWSWQRLVQLGTEGLVTETGTVSTTVDGTPLSFSRAGTFIDVATMPLGVFGVDGTDTHLKRTDALGNRISFSYNALNRQIAMIDALGQTWTFGYCQDVDGGAPNGVCAQTDPEGRLTRRDFDEKGRLEAIIDPLGNTVRFTWEELDRLVAIIDPLERVRTYEWDELGNLTAVVEPEPDLSRTEYVYDSEGGLQMARLQGHLDSNVGAM